MRKVFLLFFLLILFVNISQESLAQDKNSLEQATIKEQKTREDKWLGWDKLGHFFISGFLAGASYSIYHENFNNDRESSIYFAGILTLSAGVGKEVNDMRKPQNIFSYKDLIFDILGISVGLLVASN